jgi:hypothetical protein
MTNFAQLQGKTLLNRLGSGLQHFYDRELWLAVEIFLWVTVYGRASILTIMAKRMFPWIR